MLVALFSGVWNGAGVRFQIADSFAGTGPWTMIESFADATGACFNSAIACAQLGPAPGTGTVTVTRTAGTMSNSMKVELFTVASTAPLNVRQLAIANGTGTSVTLTFGATPLTAGLAIGVITNAANVTPGVTPPTGWTEASDTVDPIGKANHEHAYKNGSAVINPTWSAIDTSAGAPAFIAGLELIETVIVPEQLIVPRVAIGRSGSW